MSINDEHLSSGAWRPEPGWEEARAAVNGGPPVDDEVADDDPGNPHIPPPRERTASASTEVEVQFRPAGTKLAAVLAAGAEAFFAGAAANAGPGGEAVQRILLDRGMVASAYSFASPNLEAEDRRLSDMAAAGALAPPDPFAGLPSLRSFVRLRFPTPDAAADAARELQLLAEVERAVPVPDAAPPEASAAPPLPTDSLIGTPGQNVDPSPATNGRRPQWYLHRTFVPDAWAQGARGAGVVIADVDWGFRVTHQELKGRLELEHARNTFNNDNNVSVGDRIRHGTAVLGLAGAAADGRGMAGYAPEAALWAIQGNGDTRSSEQAWHNAIEYVRGADSGGRRKVLILEVETEHGGNYEQIPSVRLAIERAIAWKVVVCVAAGNGGKPADVADDGHSPIPPTGSILVGATTWDPQENPRASFSNWGSRVVVSAPGAPGYDLTCGHHRDDHYTDKFGGTSGATAKVAGAVALMLSVNPDLSHADVREILRGTGIPIPPDPAEPHKQIGVFLNAGAAVREALRRAQGGAPRTQRIEGLARRDRRGDADPGGASPGVIPVPDRTLREFRRSTEGLMTREQQQLAIDQAIQLLELFYVHRPLKEAMHAVRPIQRLRVLRRRLEEEPDAWTGRRELRLHNLLTDVFLSVRDLHTSYLLPQPYRDYTAFLPFLVRPYFDSDGSRRYMVTRVASGFTFSHPEFGKYVEILSWNGADIETAVEMNAQQTAGSNLAARHARGVDALTVRPMNVVLPPEADCVYVTFRCEGGPVQEMRQDWLVRFTPLDDLEAASRSGLPREDARAPGLTPPESGGARGAAAAGVGVVAEPRVAVRAIHEDAAFSLDVAEGAYETSRAVLFAPDGPAAPARGALALAGAPAPAGPDPALLQYQASLGMDVTADSVREAKELLFTPDRMGAARSRAQTGLQEAGALDGEGVLTRMPLVFFARRLDIGGRERAYVRIRTFAVHDPDAFVAEFIRLVEQLPGDGLILDVRGNGGGHIFAAERLLQTLTPGPIEPERLQFISSAGTLELCRRNRMPALGLSSWTGSLEQAVLTGSTYSQALPITDPDSCNRIGQRYYGPVVLLVDGRCYSATDIFAAGFEDHGIGVIVGSSPTTGAGGANVWGHDLLSQVYAADGSPLKPLPHKMGMRIAIRQTLRVGPRAGTLLEDFGVSPRAEHIHRTTRRDLTKEDADLFEFAAGVLDGLDVRRLALAETGRTGNQVHFRVDCQGIARLDFYLDGHPATSVSIVEGGPPPAFSVKLNTHLELRGFAPDGPEERRYVSALKRMVS